MDPRAAAAELKEWALAAGFDRAGVATLEPLSHGQAFVSWLERGDHAGMGYLERRVAARLDPALVLDGACSVLCVALRYWPLAGEEEPSGDLWPRVARYARGDDYHQLMQERLDAVAARVTAAFPGVHTRRYVDTGPVLERELAARAGLGVVGKNTCLLDRAMGSWFLLGELFLTLELPADEPLAELCGSCTLCLDACPTGALVEPFRLDSNRCISYWTIEHRGPLPAEAQRMVGDWVFGCDICQEVCPWNRRRHALPPATHDELRLPPQRRTLDLAGLLALSADDYVELFRRSPMKRARREGLQRNAAAAVENRRQGGWRRGRPGSPANGCPVDLASSPAESPAGSQCPPTRRAISPDTTRRNTPVDSTTTTAPARPAAAPAVVRSERGSGLCLFEQVAKMGHERILICSNPEVGLRAIVAVHSTVLGPGLGGVRMWNYASDEDALTDVLRLSRGMTYKAAAAGLNLGGGKAVILGDPKKDKSEALFRSFGRFVDSLGGLYITSEDVGTDMEDMELIFGETRWCTGVSPAHGGSGDPSPVTAYGTLQGIKAAVKWRYSAGELKGRTVAVQGLGSVGHHLAGYLTQEGAKVFGCDIDADAVEQARQLGVEPVPPEQIFDVECDIFAPCALGGALNEQTIPRLKCQIVAGAANNQLADEQRDSALLEQRGILYAPDFVINAGGLITVYNELLGGYNRERALRMTRGIYLNLTRVFETARRESISTAVAADHVAEERIATVRKLGAKHWGRLLAR